MADAIFTTLCPLWRRTSYTKCTFASSLIGRNYEWFQEKHQFAVNLLKQFLQFYFRYKRIDIWIDRYINMCMWKMQYAYMCKIHYICIYAKIHRNTEKINHHKLVYGCKMQSRRASAAFSRKGKQAMIGFCPLPFFTMIMVIIISFTTLSTFSNCIYMSHLHQHTFSIWLWVRTKKSQNAQNGSLGRHWPQTR